MCVRVLGSRDPVKVQGRWRFPFVRGVKAALRGAELRLQHTLFLSLFPLGCCLAFLVGDAVTEWTVAHPVWPGDNSVSSPGTARRK